MTEQVLPDPSAAPVTPMPDTSPPEADPDLSPSEAEPSQSEEGEAEKYDGGPIPQVDGEE
jgi:hypothetical protein